MYFYIFTNLTKINYVNLKWNYSDEHFVYRLFSTVANKPTDAHQDITRFHFQISQTSHLGTLLQWVNGVHTFYIQKNIMSNNILSIGQATFVPLSVYGPYIQVRWPSFERSSQFNTFLNLKGDGKVSVVVLGFRLVWLAIWHLQHEVVVPAFCATSQTQAQLHTHTLKHFYYSNVL